MNFKLSILGFAILFVSCTSHVTREKKIYFTDGEHLIMLHGKVKQMIEIYEESPVNVGQDYINIYFNRNGDPTQLISGFHGLVDKTDYVGGHTTANEKVIMGYFNPADPTNTQRESYKTLNKGDNSKKLIGYFRYDKENHMVQYMFGPDSNLSNMSIYMYNNYEDLIESQYYNSPKSSAIVTFYKYDDHNDIIELNSYMSNHFTGNIIFKYISFDAHHNWTKAIQTSKLGDQTSGRSFTINRKITYY
jgi:hypothetical protein